MILAVDISPDELIRRIPFLKTFNQTNNTHNIMFVKHDSNKDKKFIYGDRPYIFPRINTYIEFIYYREKINDNFFFNFNVTPRVNFGKPDDMDQLSYRVLLAANNVSERDNEYVIQFKSKNEHLTKEEFDKIINDINGHFFKLEDFFDKITMITNIKNPLDESTTKNIIKKHLNILLENKGYKVIPQDYSKEFGQTGSGKAIFYKKSRLAADPIQIKMAEKRIAEATTIDEQYREAYKNGVPDQNGIIHFAGTYMGKTYDCQIPPQFKEDESYYYYFTNPEAGDGLISITITKEGKLTGQNIRTRPDIEQEPTLTNITIGYNLTEYAAYFNVRVGVKGKYQKEIKRYSVFPTPAIDANVKTHAIYKTEILDYLKGGSDYTSDEKGKELSAKMEFDKKIEKIRKDAERIIGKPVSSNKTWIEWKEQLKLNYDTLEKQQSLDTETMTKDFVELYQNQNTVPMKGAQQISMSPEEEAEWEKQQKEKLARIALAKARIRK